MSKNMRSMAKCNVAILDVDADDLFFEGNPAFKDDYKYHQSQPRKGRAMKRNCKSGALGESTYDMESLIYTTNFEEDDEVDLRVRKE